MSIKILQITAAYKPAYIYGGPTMSVSKLCEALAKDDNQIEVFTTTANGKNELPVQPNETVVVDGVKVTYFERLTKDHTHFSPALFLKLRKEILKNDKYKTNIQQQTKLVIHIHAWWNLVSIFSCSIAKWYKIPVVLSPRGMLTNYTAENRNAGIKSIIHHTLGKNLLRYCHVHVTSDKEKQDVLSIIQPKSVTIIPNLVNFPKLNGSHFENMDGLTKEQPFNMIFLSRIEEKKGIELLFDALEGLAFNWTLTIAGSGEEIYVAALKEKAKKLQISDQVNWIGQVKNEDKFKLMAEHDLLTLTSYNENFANVIIECLSVGTPVLLSDQVGLADYVKEKELGWVTTLAIEQIKKEIQNAYESASLRKIIRAKAPQIIAEDFDSEKLIKKYTNLYTQIANGRL